MTKPSAICAVCECGHNYSSHDTGWDAAGCMAGDCPCRGYALSRVAKPPNWQPIGTVGTSASSSGKPTCLELIQRARYESAYDSASQELVSRVERVLALHDNDGEKMTKRRFYGSYHDALDDVLRLLDGEEK